MTKTDERRHLATTMRPATIAPRTYLDGRRETRPVGEPIVQGAVFFAPDAETHARLFQDKDPRFYLRFGHPSSVALAAKLAALEGAETALAFGSGMGAISSALLAMCRPGARFVAGARIFDQTEGLLKYAAANFGVDVAFVDTTDLEAVHAVATEGTTVVYVETPSNPHLLISDIAAIAEIAHGAGALLIVDSTFATPMAQRPLALGADLVVHSGTKLLNGHMDVMCGFVAGPANLIERIEGMRRLLGSVLDPHAAWLAARGLKTLAIRAERIFSTAMKIADFLSRCPHVTDVRYPMHPSHPAHGIAARQMSGGGCVVVFSFRRGRTAARRFVDALSVIQIATSLGGVETTVELPFDLDWVEKADGGDAMVDLGLTRLSVGIEDPADLIADLGQALETLDA